MIPITVNKLSLINISAFGLYDILDHSPFAVGSFFLAPQNSYYMESFQITEKVCSSRLIIFLNIGPKKVVLFPGIVQVKNFLSPTRPNQMWMRIYIFCFKKIRTQTKKYPLANLIVRIYVFSLPLFFNQEKCC